MKNWHEKTQVMQAKFTDRELEEDSNRCQTVMEWLDELIMDAENDFDRRPTCIILEPLPMCLMFMWVEKNKIMSVKADESSTLTNSRIPFTYKGLPIMLNSASLENRIQVSTMQIYTPQPNTDIELESIKEILKVAIEAVKSNYQGSMPKLRRMCNPRNPVL